jgi:hypothetical protein
MLFPYSFVFPKHGFSLSQAILSRLNERDLRGKLGFAFDIKLGIPMSGSAARFIENKLKDLGFEIISGRASSSSSLERMRQKKTRTESGYMKNIIP